jgi:nitroreductase/NAD-dependent dihydropyrimidine dehydrogenase PreA subunit
MRPHHLDPSTCTVCGLCEEVCGRDIFRVVDGAMRYAPEDRCIDCGHCVAVCPEGALLREDGSVPAPIEPSRLPSAESLEDLFRARRSTRRFRPEAPSRALLERLAGAARHAPTGTNKRDTAIVMVTDAARIEELRRRIMARYADYERHLTSAVKRRFLAAFVDRRLGQPGIRAYLARFLGRYRGGEDPLFHRAPVVALVHTRGAASTPKDDCVIALHQMVLLAERIGLGSCYLGTVEIAFARTPALNDLVGIPRGETVRAAAAFGHPAVTFERPVDRTGPAVRWIG